MTDLQNKISQLILKLSLSGLPPSFQEYAISNLDKLDEVNLDFIIKILDELATAENKYLEAAEKYQQFYSQLSEEIRQKLQLETEKIQEELLEELLKNGN